MAQRSYTPEPQSIAKFSSARKGFERKNGTLLSENVQVMKENQILEVAVP